MVLPGSKDPAWDTTALEAQGVAYQLLKEGGTLSPDGPGLPTNDHAATLRGTSYTPGDPAFLTTQVSDASLLPLLSYEAALASCLAAGTNSPIEGLKGERAYSAHSSRV